MKIIEFLNVQEDNLRQAVGEVDNSYVAALLAHMCPLRQAFKDCPENNNNCSELIVNMAITLARIRKLEEEAENIKDFGIMKGKGKEGKNLTNSSAATSGSRKMRTISSATAQKY